MRIQDSGSTKPQMSADAYAGFLKLLLTPTNQVPAMSPDVVAYLEYANQQEPLPREVMVRRGSRKPSRRAA